MEDLRFGLIGYGLFGAYHARCIAQTGGAALTAVAARSPNTTAAAKEAHPDATVVADYHDLLRRDDVDVVDVVVPNALHHEVAKAALEAGKHVLLEKPMALRVEHCDELIALAAQRGRVLAINQELRLSSLWGRVKHLIDEGRIGTPRHALVELSRFPYRRGSGGWRYDAQQVGNWILEEPIHFFDLARWYLAAAGDPASVYARANACRSEHPELNDNFTALVNFHDGAYAVVSQTLAAFGHHVSAKVVGTAGAIWAWWSGPDSRTEEPTFGLRYGARYGEHDDVVEVRLDTVPGELVELNDQIAAMVRCARDGEPPAATGLDGRWAVDLCLAAARSVDTGQVVTMGCPTGQKNTA